jgi:hypothetical protein
VAACIAAAQQSDARSALVTVSVAPDTVTIGEPFFVRVRVRAPKVATIRFPAVPDSLGGVEALDPRVIEDGPRGEWLDRTARYRFVAWNTGRRAPALGPVVVAVGGQEREFAVVTPVVYVRSLLPRDSALREPREARPPLALPTGLWRVAAALVLLAALLAWYWLARRHGRRRARREPEAYDAAQTTFASLDTLALADIGEPARHAIAHVDALRAYLARRFPVARESLSGDALVEALAASDFPILPERLHAVLSRDADVRYADAEIGRDEAVALATAARDIVRDVQEAHEARLRALDRGPPRRRR